MRTVGVVLLAVLIAACNSGSDDSTNSTASPPATRAVPTEEATSSAQTPIAENVITVGEPIPFPDDLALIIATGCLQCDGGTSGLSRLYRDATGDIRIDQLQGPVQGYAAVADGSEIAAGQCTRGRCVTIDWPSEDAQTTIVRSSDGGITWTEIGTLEGSYNVRGLDSESVVLIGPFDPAGMIRETRYLLYPIDNVPEAPAGADKEALFPIDGVTLAWWSEDARRLLGPDGSVLIDVGEDYVLEYGSPTMSAEGRILVTTSAAANASPPGTTSVRAFTVGNGRNVEHYVWDTNYLLPGVWTDEARLFGNASVYLRSGSEIVLSGLFPAIIDFETLVASPITEGFLEAPLRGGRNYVVAVQRGPFARVNTPDDCLNLRESPADGRVLECAANGVLLYDRGEDRDVDSVQWLKVASPGSPGVDAWVAAEFIER